MANSKQRRASTRAEHAEWRDKILARMIASPTFTAFTPMDFLPSMASTRDRSYRVVLAVLADMTNEKLLVRTFFYSVNLSVYVLTLAGRTAATERAEVDHA